MAYNVIETARDIIQKIKDNKPVRDELYIYDSKTSDVFEACIQECSSKVRDKDGNYRVHGSTIPFEHIKRIGRTYMNNIPQIPADIVSQAYTRDGVCGPYLPMKYTKQIDDNGRIKVHVNNLGTDIRNNELDNDELLDKYLYEPLAKMYLDEADNVSKQVKFRNKFKRKQDISNIEENLKKAMINDCKQRGIDTSRVVNLAGWLARSMGNNPSFKQKVINLRTPSLEEGAEKDYSKVLASMKESIQNEVVSHIYSLDGKVENQVMNDINTHLVACATDISGMDEKQILESIKDINRSSLDVDYDKMNLKFLETGYKNVEVVIGTKETGTRCVKAKDVPQAMDNLSKSIKDLLDNEQNLTDLEYIKEVAKIKYRFIRIHPFPNGNGRTSRALTNMLMAKRNSVIVFDKKQKSDYTYILSRMSSAVGKDENSPYLKALVENPGELDKLEEPCMDGLVNYMAEKHFNHKKACGELQQAEHEKLVSKIEGNEPSIK